MNTFISSSVGSSILYFCTKIFGSNPAVEMCIRDRERLAEKGITVRFKYKGQTGEIQGVSFSKGE